MPKRRTIALAAAIAAVGAIGGGILAVASPSPQEERLGASRPITPDERLLEVAESAPGFGGFGRDKETGEFFVYLKDSAWRDSAVDALVEKELVPDGLMENAQVRPAQFTAQELIEWKNLLGDNWSTLLPGVVGMSIREADNQVYLRVVNEKAKIETIMVLETLSIPLEAVQVEVGERMESMVQTLSSESDSAEGGIKIDNASKGGCTAGFEAVYGGE